MRNHTPTLVYHIPKTGGTALQRGYIAQNYNKNEVIVELTDDEQVEDAKQQLSGMSPAERNTLAFVHGHRLDELLDFFENPILITVVRQPEQHVVSHYYHMKYHLPRLGTPENLAIKNEGLGIIEASKRFDYFNGQTKNIARILNIDPRELTVGDIPHLLDNFSFVGLTDKLQELIYYCHKKYGWKLAPVEEENSRAELRYQFTPGYVKKEIRENSHLDQALYDEAERRFDKLFETVISSLPDEDKGWNEFRAHVYQNSIERLFQHSTIARRLVALDREIVTVSAQVKRAKHTIAEKDDKIRNLQELLRKNRA